MPTSYDLTQLDPRTFEHLVNALALQVLGSGHTEFGPGSDGGRDGYFQGRAPYPSVTEPWSGKWYIQSKFHQPHLSKDPQKWLLEQIENELQAYQDPAKKRQWPDIWIVATNIDPSGAPMTGSFDKAKEMVKKANPGLGDRFHIWGGSKILQFLAQYQDVASYYGHFLTPGHILTAIYDHLKDNRAEIETVLRYLIVHQFDEQKHTKLEQAGSDADTRPGIHHLFIDVPFLAARYEFRSYAIKELVAAASKCHRFEPGQPDSEGWCMWRRHPRRARVWFVRGGPGQGKSTIGQYFCQLQRAALILGDDVPRVLPTTRTLAEEVRSVAQPKNEWPVQPRIPVHVELKDFAQWIGKRDSQQARGVLTYVAEKLAAGVEQDVSAGAIKRALACRSWFFLFDGLDEVPQDVKDAVAREVRHFVDEVAIDVGSDILTMCTSRPQGYAGQFDDFDGPTLDLSPLSQQEALACARPVLFLGRSTVEGEKSLRILLNAMQSRAVVELMTTPLQAHIMAVVVRDGGRPPERRWQLYSNFYDVIKRREANRDLPDQRLSRLLREDSQLLKTVHSRLGYVLHARAETSAGAQTNLSRAEFQELVTGAVRDMLEGDVTEKVAVLMEATVDRLVLVSTPDDGQHVRFDIRPVQEFFAAEYLYDQVDAEELRKRLDLIAGDAHWREVTHFLLSALVENGRRTELSVAIEVLNFLNEGAKEGPDRTVLRQLCRGGLLVARLLQEGVLEQDKRVRQEFRHSLQPLFGLTHPDSLELLTNVHQPNSLVWLRSFLMDHLSEADVSEHFGALYFLMRNTRTETSGASAVKGRILSAPPSLRACLVESVLERYAYRHDVKTDAWLIDVILDLLCLPDWWKMGKSAVYAAMSFFNQHRDDTIRAVESTARSHAFAAVIRAVIEPRETPIEVCADYGVYKEGYIKEDWTAVLIKTTTPENGSAVGADVTGFFALVEAVLRFGRSYSHQDLSLILEYPSQMNVCLYVLPDWLAAQIPVFAEKDIACVRGLLAGMDSASFRSALAARSFHDIPLQRRTFFTAFEGQGLPKPLDKKRLNELACGSPSLVVSFLDRDRWGPFVSVSTEDIDDDLLSTLVDGFLSKPKELLEVPWFWGKLFSSAKEKTQRLREVIADEAAKADHKVQYCFNSQFHGFHLNLPQEASLLPYVLQGLLGMFRIRSHGRPDKQTVEALNAKALEVVFDIKLLYAIAVDSSFPLAVRCASILFTFLIESDVSRSPDFVGLLQAGYVSGKARWLVGTVADEFLLFDSEHDLFSRAVVAALLSAAKEDWSGKSTLQRLLQYWRESSHAPLHKAGNSETWLLDEVKK